MSKPPSASSPPYPRLISGENGLYDDDNDDDAQWMKYVLSDFRSRQARVKLILT